MEGITDPNPRQAFIRDLKSLVKSLHAAHHDVILMGDFNELVGAKPSEMASVLSAGYLTDTFCFRHGLDKEKATYARGTKRVDYIFVSQRLTEHIRASGAKPFNYRIFSDHRGLFVDFAMPGFLIVRQTSWQRCKLTTALISALFRNTRVIINWYNLLL
jgi:endonuclease/exonuclease/phosphatase family metal-dependent hydrolase